MLRVVSVSLGSSSRNSSSVIQIKGQSIRIERIGCDGDTDLMRKMFCDLDGQVDAFGLGGMNKELRFLGRRYALRNARTLIGAAHKTPLVDGSGLKEVMESQIIQVALPRMEPQPMPRKAMMVAGFERMGMAESLHLAGYQLAFCDFMFGLGVPIPIFGFDRAVRLGKILVPLMARMPLRVRFLRWELSSYPTGKKEDIIAPKFEKWYKWGSLVAGDFLFIRHHLPDKLDDISIITNTTTDKDVELLRQRGVRYLVTTTPRIDGRSYGTNVLEAVLVALSGEKRPLDSGELRQALREFPEVQPDVQKLNGR